MEKKLKISIAVYVRKDMHLQTYICLGTFDRLSQTKRLRSQLDESNPDLLFLTKIEEVAVSTTPEIDFVP